MVRASWLARESVILLFARVAQADRSRTASTGPMA